MKRIVFLLILALMSHIGLSQVVITMEEDGGVYKIPCLVNGTRMKLIFDTGASTVCLSETMAEYLLDNEYLSIDDFIGAGKSTVADGRIVDHLQLILRDIEIAGLHLRDVETIVIVGQKAPLLLGQSAISKLGRIELNGNQLIIHSASNTDDIQTHITNLLKKANTYLEDGLYSRAKDCFAEVNGLNQLNEYQIYQYAWCAMMTKDYKTAFHLSEQISLDHAGSNFATRGINLYGFLGWVYHCNEMDDEAVVYYKKAYYARMPIESEKTKASYLSDIASAYYGLKDYDEASTYYFLASEKYAELEGVDFDYVKRDYMKELKKGEKPFRTVVKDADNIDYTFHRGSYCYYLAGRCNEKDFLFVLSMLASNGNPYAIKQCRIMDIDYEAHLRKYGYR